MDLKIKIPEKLSDIKLKDYQKYIDIDFKDIDKEFYYVKLLDIFYNINFEYYNKMKSSDVNLLINNIVSILNTKVDLIRTFTLVGQEFGFQPNLDDITFGELVDLENVKKINETMGVLFRPIINKKGDKYNIESYEGYTKYSNLFNDMPLDVVYGALGFFLNISLDLLNSTRKSMEVMAMEQKKKQILGQNGDGILQSLNSLEKKYLSLMK